ncbi:MAG: DUF1501 domain-containing protein [Fimbriimonadaceae bacterium]
MNDLKSLTRRALFVETGNGIGKMALASMLASLGGRALGQQAPLQVKAKNVIFLFMAGAPSQLDLFDPKPMLTLYNGDPIPEEVVKGERFAFIRGAPKLLASPHEFRQVGESGQWVSNLLPHFESIADDVSVVRSMVTDQFNHAPAQIFLNTGFQLPGRPSMGSWLTYGLGSETKDLPGFVVLLSGENDPDGGRACWSSGFLPSVHQGVVMRSAGEPVMFVSNPEGVDEEQRKATIGAISDLNRLGHERTLDPEVETTIAQYELAYRMQSSVPELLEFGKETPETHALYGTEPGKRSFANNCLLARRLVERGVRCVQLYHRGWDHHGNADSNDLTHGLPRLCKETDQAAAALVTDLKQRGMLNDTLVVWAGEFGRTPMNEARGGSTYLGRDHHPKAFTIWLAGGGIKPGLSHGATDELGYNVASDPVHVHDLHATILHLMGIEHTTLTYNHLGRNFRLTDVAGEVVQGLLR